MTAAYLVRDGLVLELLHYAADGQTQPFRARTMNEPGLTHISLAVDDIDALCARVAEYGGEVVESSNIGAAVFVTRPRRPAPRAPTDDLPRDLESQGFH